MKIGVFAGTLVDTKMGVDLLEKNGFETLSYPLAENPIEQTKLQYFSQDELERLISEKVFQGKKEGLGKVFIYCNSLSSAINYERLEKDLGVPIITPLETYKNLDPSITNIAILGANGISAYRIDKIITEFNDGIHTISVGNLPMVLSIEEKTSPREIIENLNLDGFIDYLENIRDARYKIDTILLGCTHFPYLKEDLEKLTDLNIIDPADNMIARLKEAK